jgi:predicted ferric reductase
MAATISNTVTRRHEAGSGFLKGWTGAEEDTGLRFSWGLTGVDQTGNFIYVDFFAYTFLAIGLALLGLHIFNMGWKQMRHLSVMGRPDRQEYWKRNQTNWWPWLNRHLLSAPLFRKRHNRAIQLSSAIENGTIPGRWHTIILVLYVALNIAFCCALPYGESKHSVVAALRGRSGTLAALNLFPTILFALRNNPLISLLQVSYDDFNLFHRWAGRIVIVESLVHMTAWMANTQQAGGWTAVAEALNKESSYGWGMVSTVAFLFIGIQAWSPIRHAFYETFLNVHRLCVLFGLIGLYLHLELHGLPQLPWMWVIITMWSLEVALRMMRVVYTSVKGTHLSQIRVEAMPGEAVRVTVDLKRGWHPRPGCHVHIYMPSMNPLLPWTSHPFSVAWSPLEEPSSKEMTLPKHEDQVVLSPLTPKTSRQISLICRARTGLTRKLYEKAATNEQHVFTTFGAIEGPYGGHHSLDSYGTVLLFAGGVGITHQVMYLKHLVEGYHSGTTAIQRLLLVWTVPESECLDWVRPWMDSILRMPGRKQVLRVQLFITRPKRRLDSQSETVKMFPGRPKIVPLLEEEMRNRVGAMAVTCCGSGPFADDVRAAVRPFLTQGSVDFIEEAFTY